MNESYTAKKIMILKKKTEIDPHKILEAVSKVCGYSVQTLLNSSMHKITPWTAIAMYLVREEGLTYREMADVFDKTHGYCARQYGKVKTLVLLQGVPVLQEIRNELETK